MGGFMASTDQVSDVKQRGHEAVPGVFGQPATQPEQPDDPKIQPQCRKETKRAPEVKQSQRNAPRARIFLEKESRDEVSAQHEEERHASVARFEPNIVQN